MITDHVFRLGMQSCSITGEGNQRGRAVMPGMCAFSGTCNRPAADHIGAEQFRARRRVSCP